mmetsp:Transcript_32952/g.72276  ORF Transcript_32952/g.72276 Transcript_32952/m.72276 type:complete len:424 (-) Transcript_32952:198-1469(-)
MDSPMSVKKSSAAPSARASTVDKSILSLLTGLVGSSSSSRTAFCDAAPAPPPLPPLGGTGSSSADATIAAQAPKPEEATSSPPPPLTSTDSSSSPPPTDSIAEAAAAVSSVSNPGPYEHAALDAKRLVALDTHDGVRVDINKQLSPYMPVVHSFWLGTGMLPDGRNNTYTFLAQVADESGLMMARVDPGRGSVDGRIHRAVLGGLINLKLQVGVSAEGQGDQILGEADFGGQTWMGNLKYGSMGGGIVFGANYFQSVTSKLALGGEGMYIAANQNLLSNYTVKYTTEAKSAVDEEEGVLGLGGAGGGRGTGNSDGLSTIIGNYNSAQGMLSFNYKRVVNPDRVTLGAELQCSPASLESQVLVGAEFNLTRSKVNICVDGSGRVQSTLESKLGMAPGSPSLSFAAEVDHAKETMRFGYGLNIGG